MSEYLPLEADRDSFEKKPVAASGHPHHRCRKRLHCLVSLMRRGAIGGCLAFLWLMFRTGTKPSRLQYPCQQAALGLAAVTVGVPTVATVMAFRSWMLKSFMRFGWSPIGVGLLLVVSAVVVSRVPFQAESGRMPPPKGYRPEVFLVNNVRGIEPGGFGGVDDLITLMGLNGLKWHRSDAQGLTSGPEGLIAPDSVVLIKVNAQWPQRGGTNTDVLRGVIRQIVEHPDGFVGEIVVADNGQGSGSLNRTQCNAEDITQSPQRVVNDFVAEGWNVSTRLWDDFRSRSVMEYAAGDDNDGYVVNPVIDPRTSVRVSYPKFRTAAGTCISYKYGIWSDATATYDADRLVVINIPVLKTHSIYAVTAAVKNHMGVVTSALGTDAHNGVGRGGLGSVLAQVRMPDLTILDCIWVLARPGEGPSASYDRVSRRDQFVASVDPVSLDIWSVRNILMPQIIANGYAPASYDNWQNANNPNSVFRRYLDRSMDEMLRAGIAASNDPRAVDLRVWAGDMNRDGGIDLTDFRGLLACFAGPMMMLEPPCDRVDFNLDDAIDLHDVAGFQRSITLY